MKINNLAEDIKIWFQKYSSRFKYKIETDNANIQMKITHTWHVYKHAEKISKSLKLAEDEIILAKIIALLHDVGRFSQYDKYRTFADHKSINHAEESIKIIQKEKLLEQLNSKTLNLILQAIKFHNYPVLPEIRDEKIRLHARILRDADKIDIFRVVTEYYENPKDNKTIGLDLPHNDTISKDIFQQFMDEKIILSKELSNLNEFKILQLAWIFDLNFPIAITYIKENNYLKRILQTMPNNDFTRQIYQKIDDFFK
jgi:HD superfamily phosphohydrolase YqeK